jgi:hypothetical protein
VLADHTINPGDGDTGLDRLHHGIQERQVSGGTLPRRS